MRDVRDDGGLKEAKNGAALSGKRGDWMDEGPRCG